MAGKKGKFALVLGGGGARGLAHLGVLRVLQENNIKPDLIVGTSMGAVIGGMYAQFEDISTVEDRILPYIKSFASKGKWLDFLAKLESRDQRDLFQDIAYYVKKQFLGIRTLTNVSLERKELLYEPLKQFLLDSNIEDCRIPFAAVALDLRYGQVKVFDYGSIIEAVYASSAVEGVFPPLEYKGMQLSDGGPVAVVPVEAARNLGAEKVLAVDVSHEVQTEDECTTGLQVILRADTVAQDRLRRLDLARADIVLSPRITGVHWAGFTRYKYCIGRGEAVTRAAIDDIINLIKPSSWWKRFLSRAGT